MADQRTPQNEKNIPASQPPHIGFVLPNAPNLQYFQPSLAPPSYETPPPYNPTYQPGQSVTYQGDHQAAMTWVPYGGATLKQRVFCFGVIVFVFVVVSTVMLVVFFVQKNQAEAEFRERTNWNDDFYRNH